MRLYCPEWHGEIMNISTAHTHGRSGHGGHDDSMLDMCSLSVAEDIQHIHGQTRNHCHLHNKRNMIKTAWK